MRRIPILPTLIVAAACATMIGLGIWQLQRAAWKDRLLVEFVAAANLPALDLDVYPPRGEGPTRLEFRRVLITCQIRNAVPELRGGRSAAGQGGYVYLVPCRPGTDGLAGRIIVNAGWTALPDQSLRITLDGIVAGRLGAVQRGEPISIVAGAVVDSASRRGEPITLVAATAADPALQPGAPANIEDIPNNHLAYAFQWFFFALVAAVIYVLALGRRAPKLPPER